MYLQENKIRCNLGSETSWNYRSKPGAFNEATDKIVIHLKHKNISEGIQLSVSKLELTVKGQKVYGITQSKVRYYGGGRGKHEWEITNLADPQAFERIRLWIRQQETTMRHSDEAQQIVERLMQSPYGEHTMIVDDEEEKAHQLLHGESIIKMVKDLEPTLPPEEDTPATKITHGENDPDGHYPLHTIPEK